MHACFMASFFVVVFFFFFFVFVCYCITYLIYDSFRQKVLNSTTFRLKRAMLFANSSFLAFFAKKSNFLPKISLLAPNSQLVNIGSLKLEIKANILVYVKL